MLGAHSLMMFELSDALAASFGVEVPVRILFDRPTVEGITFALDEVIESQPA
jgi:hypothetical protein